MTTPRTCVTCTHHRAGNCIRGGQTLSTDLVTGATQTHGGRSCFIERYGSYVDHAYEREKCGAEGRHYSPLPPVAPPAPGRAAGFLRKVFGRP